MKQKQALAATGFAASLAVQLHSYPTDVLFSGVAGLRDKVMI
jgi:hypothetical protein